MLKTKVHTFHMVSLFGRIVFAKTMTFDPSTTLVQVLLRPVTYSSATAVYTIQYYVVVSTSKYTSVFVM